MATIRITGTYSGLDTDKIISDLMKVERTKVDKVYRQKQLLEWKKDSYREISSMLMGFADEYFNVLKTATNFRSSSSFAKFNIQSSSPAVTATANANAVKKTHTITVSKLASAAKITGVSGITAAVKASNEISDFNLSDQKILVTLDGVTKTIELENYSNIDELEERLEKKLADAFGAGKFDIVTTDGKVEIKSLLNGSTFSVSGSGLMGLGFDPEDNKTNGLTIASLYSIRNNFKNPLNISDPKENITFTINGKEINVGKTYEEATVMDIMTAINSSGAGAKLSYDSLNNRFILESTTEGATSTIDFTDTSSGLFKALGIVDGTRTDGTDAEFTLDGVAGMKRSSNQFTIDGVTYTLNEVSNTPVTISVEPNIDAVIENIKGFVNKYNEVLEKINAKFYEEYDRNYFPLTDAEKEEMTEKEIEKWEAKAKTGILAGDSILSKIVSSMRTALYEKVEGVSISLFDIGISSGSYTDKGKLKIDENKLKEALTNNFDQVVKLFTSESNYTYRESLDDSTKRTERYKQSGLAQRLYDILQDNIRTTRDSDGKKGILLEKAGYVNDTTDYDNFLYNQIKEKQTLIDALEVKLSAKEAAYYKKFASMEQILGQMQSQLSYISAITGKANSQ